MKSVRWLAVAVLTLLAVVLALAAHDALSWRSALSRGDARLVRAPASANWHASTLVPGDPTRSLLALGDDLALRRAVRTFLVAEATPYGFDNGVNQTRVRSGAEVILSDLAAHGSAAPASQAGDLLGVLVEKGGHVIGGVTYNLELLLRRTRATTTRQGPGSGSGSLGHGQRGAGAGTPGRGY
jgi:hypothetical protein